MTRKMATAPLLLAGAFCAWAGQTASPVGVWRGESKCTSGAPACHDEEVVYYITAIPDHPDSLMVRADKIVDGRAITMGTGPWTWDKKQQTLIMEWKGQVWQVTVHGDRIDGTLIMADKTVFRRMSLSRDQSPQ